MARDDDLEGKPPVPCWFCRRLLPIAKVVRDGIILAREAARGGPRRLVLCPSCLKENLCEETRKGRWFASPNVTVGILDILFSQLPGAATEEVLQAISWYRENEERRRLFFERDGDARYQGGMAFLRRLWPWWGEPEPDRPSTSSRARPRPAGDSRARPRAGTGASAGTGTGARARAGAGTGRRTGPRAPGGRAPLVTPYEVLGLLPGASLEEVRRAFHRLAVQYHPDKVHHLGEEFQAMASKKFQELMRAYEALVDR